MRKISLLVYIFFVTAAAHGIVVTVVDAPTMRRNFEYLGRKGFEENTNLAKNIAGKKFDKDDLATRLQMAIDVYMRGVYIANMENKTYRQEKSDMELLKPRLLRALLEPDFAPKR